MEIKIKLRRSAFINNATLVARVMKSGTVDYELYVHKNVAMCISYHRGSDNLHFERWFQKDTVKFHCSERTVDYSQQRVFISTAYTDEWDYGIYGMPIVSDEMPSTIIYDNDVPNRILLVTYYDEAYQQHTTYF